MGHNLSEFFSYILFFKTLLEYRSQFRNPLIMVNMGEGEHSGNCWFQENQMQNKKIKKNSSWNMKVKEDQKNFLFFIVSYEANVSCAF